MLDIHIQVLCGLQNALPRENTGKIDRPVIATLIGKCQEVNGEITAIQGYVTEITYLSPKHKLDPISGHD